MEKIIRNKNINAGAKVVYMYLSLVAKDGIVAIPVRQIGKDLGVAHQTICRNIKELEEANVISRNTEVKPQLIKLRKEGRAISVE